MWIRENNWPPWKGSVKMVSSSQGELHFKLKTKMQRKRLPTIERTRVFVSSWGHVGRYECGGRVDPGSRLGEGTGARVEQWWIVYKCVVKGVRGETLVGLHPPTAGTF